MSQRRVSVEEGRRWMQRKDAHLDRYAELPEATVLPGNHVSIAVLQEWVDGNRNDDYIQKYMEQFQACSHCQATFQHYKAERAAITS